MEIKYIGHSCFNLKGKKTSIVIDPYNPEKVGFNLPKLQSDILLISHDHDDHNYVEGVSDYGLLVGGPGEYEANETFVYGYPTFHDDKKGEERGKNTVYLIDLDGINILHLGDLGHELSKETLEHFSDVDILMIPVGGVYTINAKTAAKVISSLEPKIVIPMHWQTKDLKLSQKLDGLDKFLHEMGIEDIKEVDKFKVSSHSDIPEKTDVVLLSQSH